MKLSKVLLPFVFLAFLSGCEAIDAIHSVNSMNDKMDGLNGHMQETLEAVHAQTLEVAISEMSKSEAFEALLPIPPMILLYAKPFAENARALELVELTYLWLKDVDKVEPLPDFSQDGTEALPQTLEKLNQLRRSKYGKLVALTAIAGFAPQGVINQMIRDQIYGYGRYYQTALQVLALRARFILDVELNNGLLSQNLDVVGEVVEATNLLAQVDFVASLPFSDEISIKTIGVLQPFPNLDENISSIRKEMLDKWKLLKVKAETEIKFEPRSGKGHHSPENLARARARYGVAMQKINQNLKKWTTQ